jgi:hypothetical protein
LKNSTFNPLDLPNGHTILQIEEAHDQTNGTTYKLAISALVLSNERGTNLRAVLSTGKYYIIKTFNRGGNKGLKGKFVNRATKHSSPMETTASQQSLVTQTCEFVEDERRSAAHPSTFKLN